MLRPRVGLCLPVSIEGVESVTEILVKLCGQGKLVKICTPSVEVSSDKEERAEAYRVVKQLLHSAPDPHVFIDNPRDVLVAFVGDNKVMPGQIYLSRDKTLRDEMIEAGVVSDST